jgi:hypothetical protein
MTNEAYVSQIIFFKELYDRRDSIFQAYLASVVFVSVSSQRWAVDGMPGLAKNTCYRFEIFSGVPCGVD